MCLVGSRIRRALSTPGSNVNARLAISPGSSNPLGAFPHVSMRLHTLTISFARKEPVKTAEMRSLRTRDEELADPIPACFLGS